MAIDRKIPAGTTPVGGIIHQRSPFSVDETVERLSDTIRASGAHFFGLVDHSGEARVVGQELRPTKLLIFGNPTAGTPLMVTSPLIALDLPLKLLVWADDEGTVWITYEEPQWLARRFSIPLAMASRLAAPAVIVSRVTGN